MEVNNVQTRIVPNVSNQTLTTESPSVQNSQQPVTSVPEENIEESQANVAYEVTLSEEAREAVLNEVQAVNNEATQETRAAEVAYEVTISEDARALIANALSAENAEVVPEIPVDETIVEETLSEELNSEIEAEPEPEPIAEAKTEIEPELVQTFNTTGPIADQESI